MIPTADIEYASSARAGVREVALRSRDRWVATCVAVPGIVVCLLLLGAFFRKIANNELPWRRGQSLQQHYLAVGHAYGRGFATGFFLCFFLMLMAIVVGAWHEQRLAKRRQPRGQDERADGIVATPSASTGAERPS